MVLTEEYRTFGLRVTLLVLILLLLTIALPADQSEYRCSWCCFEFSGEPGDWWGGKPFCSQMCKDSFWDHEYARTRRCKHCGIRVDPGSSVSNTVVGYTVYTTIGGTWDGYCESCRAGIKDGYIDRSKPQYEFAPQFACPPKEKPAPPPPPRESVQASDDASADTGPADDDASKTAAVRKGVDASGKPVLLRVAKFGLLLAAAILGFYYWRRA